jgi:nucleoside-diphosphate-sugar epimerase
VTRDETRNAGRNANMKIFITGINGYIGRNLQAYFNSPDYELIGIKRSDLYSGIYNTSQPHCIIHLAGLSKETNDPKLAEAYRQVNTELTKTVYDFFLASSAGTFIFFSTVKAAAEFSETPLIETAIPHPATIYGRSKVEAEAYILDNLPHDGRKVYILRPCMIHGPEPKQNLVALYNYFRKGLPWPFGNLSNNRSYLSIGNLNFILEKLIERNFNSSFVIRHWSFNLPSSGLYHLADDSPLSTKRIIELIGETLGKKPRMINLPAWSIKAIARIGTLLHLPINQETIKKLTGNYLVSNEKIKKALNISNLPVSAEEGMRYTFEIMNHTKNGTGKKV